MNKTIILTGGGTAGHVAPNLAITPGLLDEGWNIHYIGAKNGMEKGMVASYPEIVFHGIDTGKLRRYLSLQNFIDPFKIAAGTLQSVGLLKKIKPDIIFSKGGFVSVPVAVAANLRKVPLILHESDMTPGLANKLCMPYAKKICTSFEATAKKLGEKAEYTGIPIRKELLEGAKNEGMRICSFKADKPCILFMGGSQGAAAINEALSSILHRLLTKFNVVHLCGKGNLKDDMKGREGYAPFEFLGAELGHIYAMADIAVARSGATSMFEFLSCCIPALYIPLPLSASRGDQIANARYYKQQGFADVLPQEDMNGDSLYLAIKGLYENKGRYKEAMNGSTRPDGTGRVLEMIRKYAKD